MGREIKDSDDYGKQRDELRTCYRNTVLDIPPSERQGAYRIVTDLGIRFLNCSSPLRRLDPCISDVIRKNAQSEARPWQPGQTAEVLKHMESYALNLWDYPWKNEFHTIRMFSGFFKIKVENKIYHPDEILLLLGYRKVVHSFQLLQMPTRDDIGRVAFELFLASVECTEMEKVANAVKPIGITTRVVYEVRQEVAGDGRLCADHVRERHRQTKSGLRRGSSGPKSATVEVVQSPQKKAGTGGGGGGGRGPGEMGAGDDIGNRTENIDIGDNHQNIIGGMEGTRVGNIEMQLPCHGGNMDTKSFPVDSKTIPGASQGKTVPPDSWRFSSDAESYSTAENYYDTVEEIGRGYYGFPSADKPQLGALKTMRKEKREPVPSRVSGGAIWGQTGEASSNLSFSTFRQDKSKSGGSEFKIDTHERVGPRCTQAEIHLRGRGVPIRGSDLGQDSEKTGYILEGATAHQKLHSYGRVGASEDPVTTLLSLDPEQMKDPVKRRQVMAQLNPTGSRSGPGRQGFNEAPPQQWQLQHSDVSQTLMGRHPAVGKTRDPWKTEGLGQEEPWQCGSCSYENLPQDDACMMCNTNRYL